LFALSFSLRHCCSCCGCPHSCFHLHVSIGFNRSSWLRLLLQTVVEPVPDCTSCLLYLLVCVIAAPAVAAPIPVSISLFPLDSIVARGCVFCCCVHRCCCRLSQHCHHHHHHSRICWGCTSSAASQPVCCCYPLHASSIVVAPESPPDPARLFILQGGCYQAPHPHYFTSPLSRKRAATGRVLSPLRLAV